VPFLGFRPKADAAAEPALVYAWLPPIIRRLMGDGHEGGAGLHVFLGDALPPSELGVEERNTDLHTGDGGFLTFWTARHSFRSPLPCTVSYSNDDRRQFDPTHRQICESFQVIKDPQP
jgi:hypothetical protein